MATAPDQVRAERNLSAAQVALVVLALIALLGVLWFLFLRSEPAVETAPAPVPVTTPEPTPEPETTAKPGGGPVETFEVFAPKDPFKPAIVIAAAGGGAAPAPGGTPAPGSTEDGTGGSTAGGGSGSGGGGSDTVGGHRVRLVDVFSADGEQRARVQVDGTVYTVEEGDRFADNFELLSIEGQCASMLFGDDQFTLCEGEEILK